MKKRDTLFERSGTKKGSFAFTPDVAGVFDDMAERSIPYYLETQEAIAAMTLACYRRGTRVYDLGCSTGNTVLAMADAFGEAGRKPPSVVALDSSPDMIAAAREKCASLPVQWRCERLEEVSVDNASVVIALYVLQFVPPAQRQAVLARIHDGLVPGGVLLLAEKTAAPHPVMERVIEGLYRRFKLRNGYSSREIEQKARALDGVLVPLTLDANRALLEKAGFATIGVLCKFHQFTCLAAMK